MDLEIGYLSKYNDEEIYVSDRVFRRKVRFLFLYSVSPN